MLAAAQIEAGGVLDPGKHTHDPGLAEHASATEHENVGTGEHQAMV